MCEVCLKCNAYKVRQESEKAHAAYFTQQINSCCTGGRSGLTLPLQGLRRRWRPMERWLRAARVRPRRLGHRWALCTHTMRASIQLLLALVLEGTLAICAHLILHTQTHRSGQTPENHKSCISAVIRGVTPGDTSSSNVLQGAVWMAGSMLRDAKLLAPKRLTVQAPTGSSVFLKKWHHLGHKGLEPNSSTKPGGTNPKDSSCDRKHHPNMPATYLGRRFRPMQDCFLETAQERIQDDLKSTICPKGHM